MRHRMQLQQAYSLDKSFVIVMTLLHNSFSKNVMQQRYNNKIFIKSYRMCLKGLIDIIICNAVNFYCYFNNDLLRKQFFMRNGNARVGNLLLKKVTHYL